jgi:hypothetical protein
MITDIQVQHELLKTALLATDNYLNVEAHAVKAGTATPAMLKEFTSFYNVAHRALDSLGVLDKHEAYMRDHLKTMWNMANEEDSTLADDPYTAMPGGKGEMDEAFKAPTPTAAERMYANQQKLRKEKGLPDPSQYKKMVDQKQKEINSMKSMKSETKILSFNSFINEEVENTLSEKEIEEMVNSLTWEDIVDLYEDDDLVDVEENPMNEELDEALSAQARMKKRQAFQRSKGKRNLSRGLKLRRASDPSTLQKRARLAARRSIMKKLLKGRSKGQLSTSEKDRIEKQLASMKNIMSTIQQRFVPKIRSIEQKRLANYRGKKK